MNTFFTLVGPQVPGITDLFFGKITMKRQCAITVFLFLMLLSACAPAPVAPPPVPVPAPAPEKTAEALYLEAEGLFDGGRLGAAIDAYHRFLTRFPEDPMAPGAMMKVASAHAALDRPEEARQTWANLVAAYPESVLANDAAVAILSSHYDQGRFEQLLQAGDAVLARGLNESQRMTVHTLLGDAGMAVDAPMASALHYANAFQAAAQPRRPAIWEKLVAALRLVEQAALPDLEARIADPVLRQRIAELARELVFDRTTIGCLLPLSGPYEVFGRRALRGVELAMSQYAALSEAGADIRILVQDSASTSGPATQAVQDLAEAGAAAIVGPIATAEDAARRAQALQVPLITLTQKAAVTGIGDFVFRNFITPQMQVRALVSHAVGVLGLERFAILYPAEAYGRTFMRLFWDEVIAAGGRVVGVESYDGKVTDFAGPIKKLVGLYYPLPDDLRNRLVMVAPMADEAFVDFDRLFGHPSPGLGGLYYSLPETLPPLPGYETDGEAARPRSHRIDEADEPDPIIDFDAIFIPEGPKNAGLIIPQLAFYDIADTHLLGTNLWHSGTLIDMSREYVQGALFPTGFYPESALPEVRQYVDAFQRIYGDTPGFIEAAAYDSTRILLELLAHPAVRSRSGLRDALAELSHYPGVTGLTSFGAAGEAQKTLFLMKIDGRSLVEVAPPASLQNP
jgi:ABC-type branched-subunit amino acid transport system substrate-binding protein